MSENSIALKQRSLRHPAISPIIGHRARFWLLTSANVSSEIVGRSNCRTGRVSFSRMKLQVATVSIRLQSFLPLRVQVGLLERTNLPWKPQSSYGFRCPIVGFEGRNLVLEQTGGLH